ncbi:TIGR02281 family clan AA aspartic protease [Ehrlichia ruminantium]|nr:TIGR02281 family clan AA aspartic protease [Ehrlichia ruminantium]QLK57961.1 TIGR02281 family clan AA aspartic protease [Ehrlichia ruminantium]
MVGFLESIMQNVKYILFWLGLIIVVMLFKDANDDLTSNRYFNKFFSNLGTTQDEIHYTKEGGAEFYRAKDGHFYITAQIHGVPIKFLVDTGATDVVLSAEDAKQIKDHLKYLNRKKTYHTANGTIKALYVEISEMQIGKFVVKDVKASVNVAPMRTSLLGMSFLQYFNFYMSGNTLILNTY